MTTQGPNGNGGTAMQKAGPKRPATLKDLLERAKPSLAAVVPKHMSADRLIKIALACVSRDKTGKLAQCTPESVLLAVMHAGELGLEIGGSLGEAYLVPFKKSWKDDKNQWHAQLEAQCIIGYRGFVNLARRSGEIQNVSAHVVRKNDKFNVVFGLDERIEHTPILEGDPGELVAVYAICRYKDGGYQVELMTRPDVIAVRDRPKPWSKGKPAPPEDGPWITDEAEMWRKTAVRRLAKYLPLSPELRRQLEKEDEIEETSVIDVVAEAAMTSGDGATKKLADRIKSDTANKPEASAASEHNPATGEVKDVKDVKDPPLAGPSADDNDAAEPPPEK